MITAGLLQPLHERLSNQADAAHTLNTLNDHCGHVAFSSSARQASRSLSGRNVTCLRH